MTLAKRIAALLVALEAGYEHRTSRGNILVWHEDEGPGWLMTQIKDGKSQQVVLMIGDESVYSTIVHEASKMNELHFEAIEKEFRS